MKLYRIEFGFAKKGEELVGVQWRGTQADAAAAKKQLLQGSAYDIEVDAVDVPTDKAGLLAFLNEHCGLSAALYQA